MVRKDEKRGSKSTTCSDLLDLPVVICDCQTTGPTPKKGKILEIAWACTSARKTAPEIVSSFLIKQPPDEEIPPRVSRITGISGEDLEEALCPDEVWRLLKDSVASLVNQRPCPFVIHFSRFEVPFLEDLRKNAGDELWYRVICTHEIAKRLFPSLPRRGIRALSGYLGFPLPELRRSGEHVQATAFIWSQLVNRLREDCQVKTLKELDSWLSQDSSSQKAARVYPMNPALREELPKSPGVYRMLRSDRSLLYIGKAKSIRQRVYSYFQPSSRHPDHILEMLSQAQEISYHVVSSAVEAALIESDEIKRHAPPYNVSLRTREREVVFYSRDLRSLAKQPDHFHSVGPIVEKTFRGFVGLLSLLRESRPEEPQFLPGLPAEHAPSAELFDGGLLDFKKKYVLETDVPALPRLKVLGKGLWAERLERAQSDPQTEDEPEVTDEDVADEWTSERVVGFLEGVTMRGVHQLRRARWFSLLSHCQMKWRSLEDSQVWNTLFLKNGARVSHSEWEYPGRKNADQSQFDLETYDRMVVLTTELKRLIRENRGVLLTFRRRKTIAARKLKNLLNWV